MALKENLENFLELYQNMTELSSSLDSSDSFEIEFNHLKQISQKYRIDKVYPTAAGESDVNIRKNRYKDILPFDHSRFILTTVDFQEGSDYINANYIKGITNDKAYLAAQGPLPHTVNDFWRMLWESNTQIIVMACNEFELGRHKCERYWVDEGEEHLFGDILVTQIRQQRVTKDFMIRTLKATRESDWARIEHGSDKNFMDKEEKVFNQFHYTAWPDHGVPNSVRPILDMIKLVREYQPEDNPPVVIHCSAGCGRTGTICVIDYVRHALNEGKIDQNFSLYDIIVEMRKQRHAIVQTKNQYELVHRAVVTIFQDYLGIKPGSNDDYGHNYENVQLRTEHFEQPRMPPRLPGQKANTTTNTNSASNTSSSSSSSSSNGDKRDSSSHNYVNCNITQKGVAMEPDLQMPKLPTPSSSKPSRGTDNPDSGTTLDVGGTKRQTPDDRYKSNFQATMNAFKDFEQDNGGQQSLGPVPPSPQPQPQGRPILPSNAKPAAAVKPQIAGKPNKLGKPNPPVKPGSSAPAKSVEKVPASKQDSNPLRGSPPFARSADKKALKIPVKPVRPVDRSKSDCGESPVSPGVRPGAMKPVFKGANRPGQPPPKPPSNAKPPLQKANGEAPVKSNHDYERVHLSAPPDKGKETFDPANSRNVRSSPTFLSTDSREGGPITRRKTETQRKISDGSVQPLSESKPSRKSSESLDYSYVSTPQSRLDSLIKKELAYSEVSEPNPISSTSLAGNSEYSYVESVTPVPKAVSTEKAKRISTSDAPYDTVNFSNPDPFADPSYLGFSSEMDEDGDAPVIPQRTAESYQLVDDDEKKDNPSSAITKLKAAGGVTKGFFKKIGGAINKPVIVGHTNVQPTPSDGAKHANINELLEKTLRDYQPAYKEGPVVYKDQEIGFPKRIAAPRGSRSPPRSWGVRSNDVRSAQVPL